LLIKRLPVQKDLKKKKKSTINQPGRKRRVWGPNETGSVF